MRSIFCKVKQDKKFEFRAVRATERQKKTRAESLAIIEKVKKNWI